MPNIIFPAVVELSSINGQNGIIMNGNVGDNSGISISNIGDVNGDGKADFIIGAWHASPGGRSGAGSAYLVFGGSWLMGNATLELSTLNGTTGVRINGVSANDETGRSVSSAGDVNGDGMSDFLIGAPAASPGGSAYLVFGGSWLMSNPTLELSTLNGTTGVRINGVSSFDGTGFSVSVAGDVNGDGKSDFLIGAPVASPGSITHAGSAYLVFGGSWLMGNPTLELSTLNGTTGVRINGVSANDETGYSVSSVGDVNGDGKSDFLIGASYASPGGRSNAGSAYLIYGGPWLIGNSTLELATLNGTTGVRLNGVSSADLTGLSVSSAGDVNSDGKADFIIGAIAASPGGRSSAGSAYLVFGGSWLMGNPTLELSTLNGTTGVRINGVSANDQTGFSISSAGDVTGDGMSDFLIGAYTAADQAGSTYLVFGGSWLMGNPTLELSTLNGTTGVRINGASSGDLAGSSVSSAGDINGDGKPDFLIGASDALGGETNAAGSSYLITAFGNQPPVLLNNQLRIHRGGVRLLNSSNLNATDFSNNPANLQFVIGDLQQGHFERVGSLGQAIANFNQVDVNNQQIQFVHNGAQNIAPSYAVQVNDLATFDAYVPSTTATIFYTPIELNLLNNRLTIIPGQSVVLTSNELSAVDSLDNSANLIFNMSNIQHGSFSQVINPTVAITQFNQGSVTTGKIQFTQDGTANSPGYTVTVIDSFGSINGSNPCSVTFYLEPRLINNQLTIVQGGSVTLSSNDLSASDAVVSNDALVFTASAIQSGQFENINSPGTSIMSFVQQSIQQAAIQFVQDGSINKPSYNISVSNGVLATPPERAAISFSLKTNNTIVVNNDNTARNAAIGASVSAAFLLGIFGLRTYLKKKTDQNLNNFLTSSAPAYEKEQSEFDRKIIASVTNRIFERIRTTNILSYRSESDTRDYIAAIQRMVWKLDEFRINLDFDSMDATDRGFLLSEIVRHTKKLSVSPQESYFAKFSSFFSAEMTPNQLDSKVDDISFAVKESVTKARPNLILEPGASSQIPSRQSIIMVQRGSLEMDEVKLATTNNR